MWVKLLVGLCLLASVRADKKLSSHATILADNSANLAFDLYHNMAKEKDMENILISPVVVASSLGVVALGGKASTASQVKTVLSGNKVKDENLHSGLAELLSEVNDPKDRTITWKISNRLYGPSSVSFSEDFVKNSKKHYNYEHAKINFRDKKSAIKAINEWASKSTDGKLPEVTKDVEKTDGAMIINAIFYKRKYFFKLDLNKNKTQNSSNYLTQPQQLTGTNPSITRWLTSVPSSSIVHTRCQYP